MPRSRSGKTRPGASEHSEQATVIAWARASSGRYPCLEWLHSIPNHNVLLSFLGREQGARVTNYMKAEGLTKGVLDLFLPFPSGQFHGCYIEMKLESNRPTLEQAQFLAYAQSVGYYATVCYSADEAIAALTAYLAL